MRSVPVPIASAVVAVIGFVVLVAAVLVVGVLVRDVLARGVVGDWDREISQWFARQRSPGLTDASSVGSHMAGIWETPIFMTLLVFGLWMFRRPWWATLIATAILMEGAQYVTVTYLFSRTRPHVERLEGLIPDDSFPSGHSAAAVVIYCGLALMITWATKRRLVHVAVWSIALACVGFVVLSRMYRGMHFMTDCVVGVLIGAACLALATFTVRVGATVAAIRKEQCT